MNIPESGLDYSKIVIINNSNYIDDKTVILDKDEFNRRYSYSALKYFHNELGI